VRTFIAVAITIFVSLLRLSGVGQAQTAAEIQGTLDAVDCQSGTMTLDSSGNTQTIYASDSTGVAVESSSVPFCTLDGYVGAPVDAWVVPYGSEFIATQVDNHRVEQSQNDRGDRAGVQDEQMGGHGTDQGNNLGQQSTMTTALAVLGSATGKRGAKTTMSRR